MRVNAYAKINLSLDILGTRSDGYHKVKMIMQSLQLHDTISISLSEEPEIILTESSGVLPNDRRNLAYRAAELFFRTFPVKGGCRIHIEKRIPVAAGLAGGSSDAAAVLRALYDGFQLDDCEKLFAIAGQLGADVPYCLLLGTALAEGIGEKLTPLPASPDFFCLLVKPQAGASTKEIYEGYDTLRKSTGIPHPDTERLIRAISDGNQPEICECLCNVLQPVTMRKVPEISEIIEKMNQLGANGCLMSGSGPTVYALFVEKDAAKKAEKEIKASFPAHQTILTSFYSKESSFGRKICQNEKIRFVKVNL